MEYVYKLNLPPLEQITKSNILSLLEDNQSSILTITPKDYFTEEILNLKNLNWSTGNGVYFKKPPNFIGPIHIDGTDNNSIWGINWIVGGEGGMEYWDEPVEKNLSVDSAGRFRLDVYPTTLPNKTYTTESNGVYLINASIPHRAFNISKTQYRHAISIRPPHNHLSWALIVKLFSDLIIN